MKKTKISISGFISLYHLQNSCVIIHNKWYNSTNKSYYSLLPHAAANSKKTYITPLFFSQHTSQLDGVRLFLLWAIKCDCQISKLVAHSGKTSVCTQTESSLGCSRDKKVSSNRTAHCALCGKIIQRWQNYSGYGKTDENPGTSAIKYKKILFTDPTTFFFAYKLLRITLTNMYQVLQRLLGMKSLWPVQ